MENHCAWPMLNKEEITGYEDYDNVCKYLFYLELTVPDQTVTGLLGHEHLQKYFRSQFNFNALFFLGNSREIYEEKPKFKYHLFQTG